MCRPIERLDLEDGDVDLEPEEHFGIDDVPHDRKERLLPPKYGIDQTKGPINERRR